MLGITGNMERTMLTNGFPLSERSDFVNHVEGDRAGGGGVGEVRPGELPKRRGRGREVRPQQPGPRKCAFAGEEESSDSSWSRSCLEFSCLITKVFQFHLFDVISWDKAGESIFQM